MTASVVKVAADDPDCQGLREQWYYLRFYMRRTKAAYCNADAVHLRIYAAPGGDELNYIFLKEELCALIKISLK